MRLLKRIFRFFTGIFQAAKDTVAGTIKELATNAEAVIILTFAAIGMSITLAKMTLPQMPLWINPHMLIPIISVLCIIGLVNFMNWRFKYA